MIIVPHRLFLTLCLCFIMSCGAYFRHEKRNVTDAITPYATYIIDSVIDLCNDTLFLPEDVTLFFNGGTIKNGTIWGNNTKIMGNIQNIFDKVHIKGVWNVPIIGTYMFINLAYDNALRDVIALACDSIENKIFIDEGSYFFAHIKNEESGIQIPDNTQLRIEGTLILRPCSYTNYYIVDVRGKNVIINGNGAIIGERYGHTSDLGQWGHGINICGANNVRIRGLSIKDCWGDCIYVGKGSKNILIEDCVLSGSRRQGVSITSADSVVVRCCLIQNIKGSNPQHGIDVEPNKNEWVDHVVIDDVTINNCLGAILAYGKAENSFIGHIVVKNTKIQGCRLPKNIWFTKVGFADVYDNILSLSKNGFIFFENVNNLICHDNIIKAYRFDPIETNGNKNDFINNSIISLPL